MRSWGAFLLLLSGAVCALVLLVMKEQAPLKPDASSVMWSDVLLKKRAWTQAKEKKDPAAEALRQEWADAVENFSEANPDHGRARETHEALVLEQARDLARVSRYEESIHLYEALTARRPNDAALRAELAEIAARQTLTREELASVRAGLGREQVERILGAPQPGWSRVAGEIEGWYYRRSDGGVAAVFFRNGKVFAVDYDGGTALPASTPSPASAGATPGR